jgi:MFS family permease
MPGVLAVPFVIRLWTVMKCPSDLYPNLTAPDAVSYAKTFVLSAHDQSLTTSVLSAGTFFGAIMAGDISDFIGRRLTIIMGHFIFSVGCILETASTTIGVMVARRLVAGFGVDFISAITLYIRNCT